MLLRVTVMAGLFAVASCATSSQIEDQARMHADRSEHAAARGDYELAAREKQKADSQHAKAVKRAYKQGQTAGVEVPANVPPPAGGY